MLLRRITEHVKAQNWFAVALDFFIVVVGVFIGIQVANWNEDRNDHQAYLEAHERMVEEAKRNIANTIRVLEIIAPYISSVENSVEDLRECKDDEESRDRMDVSLIYINATFAPRLENSAAAILASSERLLEQQPAALRQLYAEYARQLNTTIQYSNQWQQVMEGLFDDNHPFLDYGSKASDDTQTVLGDGIRPLILNTNMSEACKDVAFRKIFYRWENGTIYQVNLMNNYIDFTESFLANFEEERQAGEAS